MVTTIEVVYKLIFIILINYQLKKIKKLIIND